MERKRVYYFVTILLRKVVVVVIFSVVSVRCEAQKRKIMMKLWVCTVFRCGIFCMRLGERVCVWVRINIQEIWNGETYIFHLLKYTQETRRNALISNIKHSKIFEAHPCTKTVHIFMACMQSKFEWYGVAFACEDHLGTAAAIADICACTVFKSRQTNWRMIQAKYVRACVCVKKQPLHFDILNHKYMAWHSTEQFSFWRLYLKHFLYSVNVTTFYLQNSQQTLCWRNFLIVLKDMCLELSIDAIHMVLCDSVSFRRLCSTIESFVRLLHSHIFQWNFTKYEYANTYMHTLNS